MMENQSQPDSLLSSFPSWISIHGDAEYALYKEVESPPWLTYEEWAASEHPLGPYLYHLTLDAWDEVSSSDDESYTDVVHGGPNSVPNETTVTTNGNGVPHANNSSASTADSTAGAEDVSIKKRRRSKKKHLSEPILSSDDVDENAAPTREARLEKPDTSSKKRKYIKKRKSEPALLPEQIDRSTPVAESSALNSGLPTPDGPSPSSAPSRRGLRFRTPAQQRPYFHHAKLFDEEEAIEKKPKSSITPTGTTRLKLTLNPRPPTAAVEDSKTSQVSAATSPSTHQPASEGRRKSAGKGRTWKKDDEDDDDYTGAKAKKQKKKPKSRKSWPMLPKAKDDPDRITDQDEVAELAKAPPPAKSTRKARKSHLSQEFVRESDSDEDVQDKSSAIQTKVEDAQEQDVVESSTAPAQPSRTKRRPRKSYISEEFIVDDSDSEGVPDAGAIEVGDEPPPRKETKQKRKPKRAYISQEFVVDDSDSDGDVVLLPKSEAITKTATGKSPKGRGRPKKSESIQSSPAKRASLSEPEPHYLGA